MTNPRLMIKILNLFNGALLVVFMLKLLHISTFLNSIKVYHLVVVVAVVYGLKSWIEISNKVGDPVKQNKVTNMLFNVGFAIIIFGILFQVMHWPYRVVFYLLGASTVLLAYILSFVLDPSEQESDSEILDDFN